MEQVQVRVVPLSSIVFGERFRVDYGNLKDLVESFKREGIISPLAVQEQADGSYKLAAGGRRYKAAMEACISEVPVRVFPECISELQMRSIELMENVCRKDLDWVEAAKLKSEIDALQKAIHGEKKSTAPDAPGWSQRDTADLLGLATGTVSEDIALANALTVFPELKSAKNKAEAKKMLKKLQIDVVQEEISKRLLERRQATPLDQLRADLCNRYIVADFFEGIKKIPDRSMDIVEMDPPYGIDLQHIKKHDGQDVALHLQYNEIPKEDYMAFVQKVLRDCYRVMSENSWLIMWFAQEPWFEAIYQAIISAGFQTRRIPGIWYKGEGQLQTMQPEKYLANAYEPFFYASKGRPAILKQGRSNVFDFKPVPPQKKTHPTERPIELIQELLGTFGWEGARILVPFLGSGATILAAANLGMTAMGFDLTQEYKNSYIVRVHESRPGEFK